VVGNPGAEPGISWPRTRRITVFLVPGGAGHSAVINPA